MPFHGATRVIVVANRLPVTISKDERGTYQFKVASGGLVSALSSLKKEMPFIWIGWPGMLTIYLLPSERQSSSS